jgi:hypothetical protein
MLASVRPCPEHWHRASTELPATFAPANILVEQTHILVLTRRVFENLIDKTVSGRIVGWGFGPYKLERHNRSDQESPPHQNRSTLAATHGVPPKKAIYRTVESLIVGENQCHGHQSNQCATRLERGRLNVGIRREGMQAIARS